MANSEAINFKVKIRLDSPPDTIRPGFSVTADIVTARRDGTTAIPIQALVVRDVEKKDKAPAVGRAETEEGVYTIKDGKLAFSKVKTGIAGELMIEVTEGPKVGQEIVTGPFKVLRQVKDGDRVIIEKEGERRRAVRSPRDDLRALPRLGGGVDAPQAARVPDAAGRHHRRGDCRGRRFGHLGAQQLRQRQGHRPEPRHRHLHEVRDHHEPRGVAAGPHAGATSRSPTWRSCAASA